MITIKTLELPEVLLLEPGVLSDSRGAFSETYRRSLLESVGIDIDFVQDNQSVSLAAGTVRGLHFQRPPFAQAKLVRTVVGSILDVAVDIRRGSPTYGRHIAVELSAANRLQLYIPEGFAHGFQSLTPDAVVQYKVSAYYVAAAEGGVLWNDPALGIDWPIAGEGFALNERDANWPELGALASPFA